MSWLPQDKLTTEEKEKLKELQQRKDSLIGKYHTQIKSQTTTHETWLNTFITDNTKKFKSVRSSKIEKLYLTGIELKGVGLGKRIILAYLIIQMRTKTSYSR